jgi:hypothetical protein
VIITKRQLLILFNAPLRTDNHPPVRANALCAIRLTRVVDLGGSSKHTRRMLISEVESICPEDGVDWI